MINQTDPAEAPTSSPAEAVEENVAAITLLEAWLAKPPDPTEEVRLQEFIKYVDADRLSLRPLYPPTSNSTPLESATPAILPSRRLP